VDTLKNILFIIITIMLAVIIEAMTINSTEEINNINEPFEVLSAKSDTYSKDVSLSEIIYNEDTTKGLMQLIIDNGNKTFKNISHREFIHKLYQQNGFTPIWFTYQGAKSNAINDFFRTIENDPTIDKKGYIYKRYLYLKKLLQRKNLPLNEMLKLDIQLSSLYKSYMDYHIYGSIKWWNFQNKLKWLRQNKINADWVTYSPKYDTAKLLLKYPVSKIVDMTTPNNFGYRKMLKKLKRLREIKKHGGWAKIPNSSQLRYGRSGKIVGKLINRLKSSGDYRCRGNNHKYDRCLKDAIKRFQKRHGIYPNGVFNSYTRKMVNLSVDWKINKVLLNLDRIKRLPRQPKSGRYIIVNIPDFRLYYYEHGRKKLSMPIIVGDKKHHTPIFSNEISYIVLNPYWIMPDSIVKKEIIPNMLKNPNYLKEKGYEVRTSYSTKAPTINTDKIDWAKVLRYDLTKKYKFMQPPGPKNALGKIKFKFPNQFAVYLHDTPTKKLFKKGVRAFSHGCIRISQPNTLLYTFARNDRAVSYNRVQQILRGKERVQLNLSKSVPVHIVYLTAWVHNDGLLYFKNDIYHYDKKQKRTRR